MQAKLDAAVHAVREGTVQAVVIASGFFPDTISKIVRGEAIGTLFIKNGIQPRAISAAKL